MNESSNEENVKIESLKHFKKTLTEIDSFEALLRNIDSMYRFASARGKIYMLINVIMKKVPSIHSAFVLYVKTYNDIILDKKTGQLCHSGNISKNIQPPSIIKWLEETEEAQTLLSKGAVMKPEALNAQRILVDHASPKVKKRKKRIWTISGGGANGTGKRR